MSSKELYKTKYLSLLQSNLGFFYSERRNYNSTATLCYRKNNNNTYSFLIRYQLIPEIKNIENQINISSNHLYPCPITGSFENNQSSIENVISEVFEEAEITINKNDISGPIIAVATTQSNECVYHFIADATNSSFKEKTIGDGSYFEKVSVNKWVDEKTLEKMLFKNYGNSSIFLSSLLICYSIFKNK